MQARQRGAGGGRILTCHASPLSGNSRRAGPAGGKPFLQDGTHQVEGGEQQGQQQGDPALVRDSAGQEPDQRHQEQHSEPDVKAHAKDAQNDGRPGGPGSSAVVDRVSGVALHASAEVNP